MASDPTEWRRSSAIPRYARIDVIGGAVMVGLAGLIWYGAIGLNVGTLADFASGAMPKALALVLLAAGGVLLLQGLTQRNDEAERFEIAIRPTAIVVLSIVLFGLFIRGGNFGWFSTPQLGLILVGPVTIFVAGCATPEMRVKQLAVLSFGMTAGVLILFVDVLSVTIPVAPKFIQDPVTMSYGSDILVRVAYSTYAAITGLLYVVFFKLPEKQRG